MATTSFTFLNTTDAPGLSRQAAKVVRGHVTKTNFAKRRQRKADTRATGSRGDVTEGSNNKNSALVHQKRAGHVFLDSGEQAVARLGNAYNRDLRACSPPGSKEYVIHKISSPITITILSGHEKISRN